MLACGDGDRHKNKTTKTSTELVLAAWQAKDDKTEIRDLIRKMLNWAESQKTLKLVPELTDSKDSLCIGFDLKKLETNLQVLKATEFFTPEFIYNYKQIILTLDRKVKNNEFKWVTDELPPFNFANDVDPWCDSQDEPYDKPNPWDLVEVKVVSLNKQKGEFSWTWGQLKADMSPDWKEFNYRFKVQKEQGKWKIAYLDGFDFKQGTTTM
ncbi:hypothetical protein [Mucilaginibacter sp. L3T2-6]|uniref:hypothetical protein n=1 Tax=Mucilaginibacter sp. L3T2-6 TaxID=3062491 RepID=UPI002675F670|nr:hypothetical protein [Mucilaginibacter sp. L3T2-6]MDO3641540.1 hypothetical protein [Mucilaginibacter sp. L3T2-6]MDV6214034.1 hypothetical protein [Mucilaginibacter sp. L3T2-6]